MRCSTPSPLPFGSPQLQDAKHPQRLRHCTTLLAAKDILAGDVVLTWGADIALEDWEGVSVNPSDWASRDSGA